MSVGRMSLSNFDKIENEMCWVNGFAKLKDDSDLRQQLKRLDNYRSKQLSTLIGYDICGIKKINGDNRKICILCD